MTAIPVHRLVEANPSDPLIVLVHGMEATWSGWQRLAGRLGGGYRIWALELPWQTGCDYRWSRQGTSGDWLARAVAALDEPIEVLMGHSFGANAVLEFLAAQPFPPPRLAALVAPFYRPREYEVSWTLFEETRIGFESVISQGLTTWLGRRGAEADPVVVASMAGKLVERLGPLAFTVWFDHFVASTELALDEVAVPTLVLAGPDDPCLAAGRAGALGQAMPSATVIIDERFDHFCHIRQASRVAEQLRRFVAVAHPMGLGEGSLR